MAEDVLGAYERFATASDWYGNGNSLKHAKIMENNVFHKWNECFSDFEPKQSNSSTAKILENTTIKYSDFIKGLNRKLICIDDARSALTNKHKYRIIYTDSETYLTKDPSYEPAEEELTGLALFEGL